MKILSRSELEKMSQEEALLFAIGREDRAHSVYSKAAGKITNPGAAKKLRALADEELQHKKLLMDWLSKAGGDRGLEQLPPTVPEIPRITAGTVLGVVELAMEAETEAFHLYSTLAERAVDSEAGEMFLKIAQEEKKHREHLEHEYEMLKDSVEYWFTKTLQEPGYLERD
jgi:rubrerythrin